MPGSLPAFSTNSSTHSLGVELTAFEQVLDTQQDFDHFKGFHHKVRRAAGQSTSFGFRRRIRRQDQNREGLSGRNQRSRRLHDGESIEVGHLEIEEQEVGLPLRVERKHSTWVGRRLELLIACLTQDALEEPDVPPPSSTINMRAFEEPADGICGVYTFAGSNARPSA